MLIGHRLRGYSCGIFGPVLIVYAHSETGHIILWHCLSVHLYMYYNLFAPPQGSVSSGSDSKARGPGFDT